MPDLPLGTDIAIMLQRRPQCGAHLVTNADVDRWLAREIAALVKRHQAPVPDNVGVAYGEQETSR